MRRRFARGLSVLLAAVMMASMLTGCKPSRKKVVQSSYYQNLLKKKEKLEKENDKLTKKVQEAETKTQDSRRASEYLKKLGRNKLDKLVIGYSDDMDDTSTSLTEAGSFQFIVDALSRADLTTLYTVKTLEENYEPKYEYILYDEDNTVYEMKVYGKGYVIFSDLPDDVYYIEDINTLGDAFLPFTNGYPDCPVLHRMADSSLITSDDKKYYCQDISAKTATFISQMNKKKASYDKAVKEWKKNYKDKHKKDKNVTASDYLPDFKTYTYHYHGATMKLMIYDKYICIENKNGDRIWYQTDKDNISQLKDLFKEEKVDTSSTESEDSDSNKTHDTSAEEGTTERHHNVNIDEEDPDSERYSFIDEE